MRYVLLSVIPSFSTFAQSNFHFLTNLHHFASIHQGTFFNIFEHKIPPMTRSSSQNLSRITTETMDSSQVNQSAINSPDPVVASNRYLSLASPDSPLASDVSQSPATSTSFEKARHRLITDIAEQTAMKEEIKTFKEEIALQILWSSTVKKLQAKKLQIRTSGVIFLPIETISRLLLTS